jgi:hypothetical protein
MLPVGPAHLTTLPKRGRACVKFGVERAVVATGTIMDRV